VVNGDEMPDIVVTSVFSDDVTLMTNTTPHIATKLAAGPLLNKAYPAYTANAVLVNKATGQPISGQTITFTTGKTPICSAKTNGKGLATCRNLSVSYAEIASNGYTASYAPATIYLPASAKGVLM
jgi:hypothetical protein